MWKNMIFRAFLLLLILSFLSFRTIKGFIPLPIGIRHLFNLIISPKDLYQPIVVDNFLFYEENFSKTYSLYPKYLEIYEVGFLSEKSDLSSKYKFKGKIKIEFLWKDKLLFEKIVTSINRAYYSANSMLCYKGISLTDFEIPLQGKYKDDIKIRLTVLSVDQELKKYNNSIKLYIAVSGAP